MRGLKTGIKRFCKNIRTLWDLDLSNEFELVGLAFSEQKLRISCLEYSERMRAKEVAKPLVTYKSVGTSLVTRAADWVSILDRDPIELFKEDRCDPYTGKAIYLCKVKNIQTVEQLINMSTKDVRIPNLLGALTVGYILTVLNKYGLSLKGAA